MPEKNIHPRLELAHRLAELFDSRLPYFKGARQLRNSLTRILAPPFVPPCTITTRYGFKMVITTTDDGIDYNVYTRGTYEAGTLNIIQACLREGDTFVDVGANIGLMSLLGAMQVGYEGTVYPFEPEPDTYRLLQRNISINKFENIHAVNSGIGSTSGVEVIYRNQSGNRGMASFIGGGHRRMTGTEVSVCTLDEFLAENNVDTVRMMKVDVEGWELEVLKGAQRTLSRPDAPILCIEYNTSYPFHKDFYELMTSINSYQTFVLPHGNWHASRLVQVKSVADLPAVRSVNLYCFLRAHLQTIPKALFK